jgi:hypothetical protein
VAGLKTDDKVFVNFEPGKPPVVDHSEIAAGIALHLTAWLQWA